jgi:hypothetical protein
MVADPSASRNEQVAKTFGPTPEGVRNLVRALGRLKGVAHTCGVSLQAVSNWTATGRIPTQHHATLWRLAQSRGVPWTPPGFEGVRLLPVDAPHEHDHNVNIAPSERECSVNLGDAA